MTFIVFPAVTGNNLPQLVNFRMVRAFAPGISIGCSLAKIGEALFLQEKKNYTDSRTHDDKPMLVSPLLDASGTGAKSMFSRMGRD